MNKELYNFLSEPKLFCTMFLLSSINNHFYLRTRIQKAYFLFIKEFKKKNTQEAKNDFIAYNFGPYSKKVDEALVFLKNKSYINYSLEITSENNEINSLNTEDFDIIDTDNLTDEVDSKIRFYGKYWLDNDQVEK
ncbi:MAG: hypothetical protein K2J02_00785, partial [Malacoplasma sp.]|nr:hypothetical protein [Malacoplasma sp.]